MFKKILIANRGEIACRIAATGRRLGIQMATIHSQADRDSLHVRVIGESIEVGGAAPSDSYLNIAAIVDAARSVGAEAVHPGIGFLSENHEFAEAVEAAGMVFIGPRPETMRRFSDKWDAKSEAIKAKVPVVSGSDGNFSDPLAVEAQVRRMPLPVLLKASAGGGGRGVRVVQTLDRLSESIESAMREANSSFGRPDLLIEQFIDRPRHIEIQIAGDGHGEVIHLFERECSLQRRFQKIIEEAPASGLDARVRADVTEAAVRLGRQVSYRGLGTMEFLVTGDSYFFLECNPRLQVEHTVTEEITGLDLIELQLRIAAEGALPLLQSQVKASGHAVQARIYAEDPGMGFMPSTGKLLDVHFPHGSVRVDAGVESGSEVTPHYDAMIGKIVAVGSTRVESLAKLKSAIDETAILGVQTNLGFLSQLLAHPTVIAGTADNRFIDREISTFQHQLVVEPEIAAIACVAWLSACQPVVANDPWSGHGSWRLGDGKDRPSRHPSFYIRRGDQRLAVTLAPSPTVGVVCLVIDGYQMELRLEQGNGAIVRGVFPGRSISARVATIGDTVFVHGSFGTVRFNIEPLLTEKTTEGYASGHLAAPMMGKIIRVNVAIGDSVRAKDQLIIQESMKMELSIDAPYDGKVLSLACACGDMVERNALLVTLEPN